MQKTTIDLSMFPEEDVDLLDDTIKDLEEMYKNYRGAQYSAEIKDNFYYEVIKIDMTNENTITSLTNEELLPIEAKANKTSLDDTIESLKSNEWTVEMK